MKQDLYVRDAKEFLEKMKLDKKVLVVAKEINDCQIFDISLHKKGPREDKSYLKYPFYLLNIRRGNTIIEIGNNYQFCRRGMIKFYDLENKFIQHILNNNVTLTGYENRQFNNIFLPLQKAFEHKTSVIMYKLFKENGEHCQFSFTNGNYLIASKNSTIFIRDLLNLEEELLQFNEIRYTWPKLIAREWTKLLLEMKEEQRIQFNQFLSNHTIIGEYCGNQQYQHITRYNEIELKFYAIVENNSDEMCMPVDQVIEICKMFNLKFVKYHKQQFDNYQELIKTLEKWQCQIAQAPMQEEGEGSVCYFVQQINDQQMTISICKLKSIEYLIYRTLRELVKILANKVELNENYNVDPLIKRFTFEFHRLTEQFKPPRPLKYYTYLAKTSFDYVYQNKICYTELRYKFVDFLDKMMDICDKHKNEIEQIDVNIHIKRHTRILLITMPLLLTDLDLSILLQNHNVQSIECQYMCRNQNIKCQRAMSILHILPRLMTNLNNQQILNQYISQSTNLNDPSNIVFVFYKINQKGFEQSMSNFNNQSFQNKNQQISSYAVQFTTLKPKMLETSLITWLEKAKEFEKQTQLAFPDRTFILDEFDYLKIENIYQQFEITNFINETQKIETKQTNQNLQELVIIYPLLIPGCGKTTLLTYMQNNYKDYPFYTISGDEITYGLIKDKLGNSEESLQIQFKKVFKDIKATFFQALHKKICEIVSQKYQKCVLFIDRNCIPNTLSHTIESVKLIKEELNTQTGIVLQIHDIGLIFPQQQPNLGQSPFNLEFLLTILNRLLERNDHILLGNELMYKVLVCFKNICLFNGFKAKQSHYNRYELQKVIEMTPFQDKFELNQQDYEITLKLAQKCVENSSKSKELGEGEEYDKFIQQMYYLQGKYQIQKPNVENECERNMKKIVECINKIWK